MNKRKEHPLLSWAAAPMMLLAYLLLLAPQWGAEPGAGLGSHLRYSLSYGLHMPTALVLPVLLAAVLQGVLLWLLTQEQGRPQLPELLLAAFFTQNILIGMTEDRRLNFLLAYPGLSVVENILVWAGLLLSCAIGIRLICARLQKPGCTEDKLPYNHNDLWLWAGITLLGWLPFLILRAPGGLMYDTVTQIRSFQGEIPMDASHPLLTTLVYGSLYTLGQRLAGDDIGILLCMLLQLGVTLFAVSFASQEVAVARGSRMAGLLVSLFFGLVQVFPAFVRMVLRDSLFGPLYLLFALFYRRVLRGSGKRDPVWLLILGALCSAARKGGVFLVVLSLIALAVYRKPVRKLLTAGCLGLLAAHWALAALICPIFNIRKPAEFENYSQFYYITGFYCQRYAQELTPQEQQIIADVLDYDAVLTKFNPDQIDSVKFTYHAQSAKQVRDYLLLNGKFFLRHPLTVLEGIVYSRCNYFLPLYNKSENIMGRMESPWLTGKAFQELDDRLWDINMTSPLRILNFSGLYNWLCLILAVAAWESRSKQKRLLVLPALLMTLGLLTTHTNGAVRYALPVMFCVPVLLAVFDVDAP